MATGTGLPIPKRDAVTSQAPGVIDGDKYSSAQAWSRIAAAGSTIASAGENLLRQHQHRQEIAYYANSENAGEQTRIELSNKFKDDPEGFREAWRAHTDGTVGAAPSWAATAVQRNLNRLGNSAYSSLLQAKVARDDKLALEAYRANAANAENDVVSLSMQGRINSDEGNASIAKLRSVYDAGVTARFMSTEEAERKTNAIVQRAQAESIIKSIGDSYRVARDRGDIDAAGSAMRMAEDTLLRGDNKLSETERWGYYQRSRGEIRALEAERKQDVALARQSKSELETAIRSGVRPDQETIESVVDQLNRAGDTVNAARLQASVARADANHAFGRLPLSEMNRELSIQRGDDPALIQRESGGRPAAFNKFGYAGLYQYGAPRLATLNVYQPGPGEDLATWSRTGRDASGKWSGTFNIPGHPEVRTLYAFLHSPEAQRAVRALDVERMDADSASAGLDRFVGQTVGGVAITREGIRNMMHLGGLQGARQFLESNGAVNVADANGTTVGDYAKMGAQGPRGAMPTTDFRLVADQVKAANTAARQTWKKISADLDAGNRPTTAMLEDIINAATITGDHGLLEEIADRVERFDRRTAAGRAPLAAQDAAAAELAQAGALGGLEPGAKAWQKDLTEVRDETIKGLKDDPIGTLVKRFPERFKAPDPLNLSSPQAAAESLRQRVAIAQFGEQNYQVPAIVPLSKADRLGVAAAIGSGRPEAANAFAVLNAMPENMLMATLDDKAIKDAIAGGALSMDPARFNAVMSGLDQIAGDGMPRVAQEFSEEIRHRLLTWQSNYRYLSPEQMAEELKRYPDPKLRKEAEKPALAEANKRSAADIVKAFDTSWPITPGFVARNITGSQPIAPTDAETVQALRSDYNTIFARRYRDLNGDADQAHAQTIELMKTRWSRSDVNGGKLMLRAPEQNYPAVGGSHDWMKKQIETDLTARFGERESIDRGRGTMTPNWSYTLVTDRTTEAESTSPGQVLSEFDRRPYRAPVSYQVVVTDHKTGRTDLVRDESQRPMRFRFDPTEPQQQARERFGVLRGWEETRRWADTLDDNRRPFAVP